MTKCLQLLFLVLSIILINSNVAISLTIVQPTEGQIVNQGDKLKVIVHPNAEEKWDKVLIEVFPMQYDALSNTYNANVEIPRDETGNVDIVIKAFNNSGKKLIVKRTIFVKMPPNVVLESISVDDLMILYKAPAELNSDDKKTFEVRQITVAGIYSDGFSRQIPSSSWGTTYTSSDEKIVTVDSEGKVTPQTLGTATITVKNGKYSKTVKVIVKPYNKTM